MASWSPLAGASELADVEATAGRAQAAQAQAEAARANARLEIEQTRTALSVALTRLDIAEHAAAQSAEAHRIVSRKYSGGLAGSGRAARRTSGRDAERARRCRRPAGARSSRRPNGAARLGSTRRRSRRSTTRAPWPRATREPVADSPNPYPTNSEAMTEQQIRASRAARCRRDRCRCSRIRRRVRPHAGIEDPSRDGRAWRRRDLHRARHDDRRGFRRGRRRRTDSASDAQHQVHGRRHGRPRERGRPRCGGPAARAHRRARPLGEVRTGRGIGRRGRGHAP